MRASAAFPALALALLLPSIARAEPVIRAGANGLFMGTSGAFAGGGNGAVAVGYNAELEPLVVLPELTGSFGYHGGDFSGPNARALAGLRIGAALAAEPFLILRGGYGHVTVEGEGFHGGAVQLGLGADYRISRDLTFGGEASYDLFIDASSGEMAHGLVAGVSVAFWL